ncbi:SDR family NAD(P)-dependent oxidoreductase [Thiomicrorhabdus aquaedulcis]|uniref:SDR family NAD(P)-dependent oxidoreductase n=1 Tax=Thiomicrorhabdus aquaedulcis TaxID=2211106 RepID=UPI000FD6F0B5|nr:SDR family NAD(P)-dependent oxidoreductase [Thiomicrorhabdus aquaedulcis]
MKTYLITGAASGLGKAFATELIARGHHVILIDKELEKLYDLCDQLDSDQVTLYPLDLLGANIEHYKELRTTLTEYYTHLDGVILNAAIMPAFTPIAQFDYSQWYEVLHTNLNANFHIIQQTLSLLTQAPNGQLVGILDRLPKQHPAFYGAYGVAKAGLEQLCRTVAAEQTHSNLGVYLANLPAFATAARGRLFPGENPNDLPSPQALAKELLNDLLDEKAAVSQPKSALLNRL